MIPPGSLDDRHHLGAVMHFLGKGQGLTDGNAGMWCLGHPRSVTQDLLEKPPTCKSSGTIPWEGQGFPCPVPHEQDPAQVLVTLWGGDFGAARPRLTLNLFLPTPVAAVAQQRRAGNDPTLRNCLLNPPKTTGINRKSSC